MFAHLGPEALLVSVSLLIAIVYPELGARWFNRIERGLAAVARRERLSVLVCGVSALALRFVLLPWLPIPKPYINDEFSFLLASDTFAHGRLTNPVHPMWVHFETFHVIFHPTYASMYPPLQGLFLAAGQVIAGHPFWGVWFSVGLMSAAICWMLQAWLPASWAFLGGMLPVLRFGVLSYWDNSYWGGALAATGGALLLGALPRIISRTRVFDAILMAFGMAMLANTRPYEGMMLTLAASAIITVSMVRTKPGVHLLMRRVACPILLVLVPVGLAMAYYFWRVTGNALLMPQQLNRETYAIARYFYWQTAYREPYYHHKAIRDFYEGNELILFRQGHHFLGIIKQTAVKLGMAWVFYVSPVLSLPFFLIVRVVRDRRIRLLVIAGAAGLVSSGLVIYFNIHYISPVVCVLMAIMVQGMRHLRTWNFEGRPAGKFLVRAIVVMTLLMIPVETHILAKDPLPGTWEAIGPERVALEARLASFPNPQLVLVCYGPRHDPLMDWVYNGAEIDSQKVIWARDMGTDQNQELLSYYRNRDVWLLNPDMVPHSLSLLRTAGSSTR